MTFVVAAPGHAVSCSADVPLDHAARVFPLIACVLLSACRKSDAIHQDPAPPAPPVVRTVADHQDRPTGIFVDATHVYWTNQGSARGKGSVARAEKKPNAPTEVLVDELDAPFGIAVDAGRAYWSSSQRGKGGLGWVSISDKAQLQRPALAVGALEEPTTIAVDHGELFFADVRLRRVGAVAVSPRIDTANVRSIANTDARPVGVAVDETNVYWADSSAGVICRAPRAGGPITTLVARGDQTVALALDDQDVWFAETGSGRIGRVHKAGGGLAVVASDQAGVLAIAVDRERVYWSNGTSGTILSMPKSGGAMVAHATHLAQPTALAVDDADLYWVEQDAGLVRAVAKR